MQQAPAVTNASDPSPSSRLHALAAAERGLLTVNRWALVLLLAAMAALVITNVISRYVFSHSFTWVEEASRYGMIWAAFLGAGMALRVGGHIAIDSLPSALPPAAAKALRAGICLVIATTLCVVTWLGIEYVRFGWEQETPVLGWSFGAVYLAIPLGALLMLAHLACVAPRWIATGEWERIEGFDPQAL